MFYSFWLGISVNAIEIHRDEMYYKYYADARLTFYTPDRRGHCTTRSQRVTVTFQPSSAVYCEIV